MGARKISTDTSPAGKPTDFLRTSKLFIALEVLLGAAIVIGHNVFHVVPNEVPILVVLGLVSIRLRAGRWSWAYLGFARPASWSQVVLVALGIAALRIVLGNYVIEPLGSHFWGAPNAPAASQDITGNLKMALLYLLFVWGFAAFGEEFAYRGYLLARVADCGGRSATAYWAGVVIVAVLFGFGHYYKGPVGMIDSGVAGLLLGAAYVLSGRNLWLPIMAHGFIDTFAVVIAYLGFDT